MSAAGATGATGGFGATGATGGSGDVPSGMFLKSDSGSHGKKGGCWANEPKFEVYCEKQSFTKESCLAPKCHWNPVEAPGHNGGHDHRADGERGHPCEKFCGPT